MTDGTKVFSACLTLASLIATAVLLYRNGGAACLAIFLGYLLFNTLLKVGVDGAR